MSVVHAVFPEGDTACGFVRVLIPEGDGVTSDLAEVTCPRCGAALQLWEDTRNRADDDG